MNNLLTVSAAGRISKSINLDLLTQAWMALAEKNPDATLDSREATICLEQGYGPVWIYIQGHDPIRRSATDPVDVFVIAPNTTARFVHDTDINASFSLTCAPSGQISYSYGYDLPRPLNPQQAPQGAPAEVQQAYDWMFDGEVGSSSQYLVDCLILEPHQLTRTNTTMGFQTPGDGSDWRRCFLLAERIPYIKDNLHRMSEINELWAEILDDSAGPSEWDQRYQAFLQSPPAPEPPERVSQRLPRS